MPELELIKKFYEEAFHALNGTTQRVPEIEVRFYPYIGINHTIRVRDGKVFVRLAELSESAPIEVHKALAFILVGKLLRKKILPQTVKTYREFAKTQEIQAKATENKRAKGRKVITTSTGEIYDLEKIFHKLNLVYFQNSVLKPTLTWSARKTYRILGHHDATHETIVISKSLDNKKVPKFVVEFVVFHEMLHIFHPTTHRNGRRYNHTTQFRADEKKFAYFEEAESWIEQNARNLKRGAKRK
jgi:predicted metal-dependent hydrolase